jgi:hypothetical protein
MERTKIYVSGEEVRVVIGNDGTHIFSSESGVSGMVDDMNAVREIVKSRQKEKQQRSKK